MARYGGVSGLAWLAVGIALVLSPSLTLRVGVGAESGRVPWMASRVVGSPEAPPPFRVVRAFENLKFDRPLLLTRLPGSERLFLGEQGGKLYSFVNKPDAKAELFLDLKAEVKTMGLLAGAQGIDALYGLAFHPDFEKNRQCFVCYTLRGSGRGSAIWRMGRGCRVFW